MQASQKQDCKHHDNTSAAEDRPMRNRISDALQILLQNRLILSGVIIVACLLLFSVAFSGGGSGETQFIFKTVARGDLPIDITVSGNLESQENTKILCELDDIRGDGIWGTPILWVIENGSSVKEGDLLVEFDVTNHQDGLDDQILETEESRSQMIKARTAYENQITKNTTALAEAELDVQLAELALQQYFDENGGTFQISMQKVDLQIKEAQASLLIEQTNREGVEQLYKLGYRSSGELAQARLSYLRTERTLQTSSHRKKSLKTIPGKNRR